MFSKFRNKNSKSKLRIALLFMVVLITIPALPGTAGANSSAKFSDVPKNNSHHDAIVQMTDKGYIAGYPDGTFRPNEPITRAHAALIMNRVRGFDTPSEDVIEKTIGKFSDVDLDHPYASQIANVANHRIFNGYQDGTFRPENNITRQQMATVIVNTFNLYAKRHGTIYINTKNVHPSHQMAVKIIADYGITVERDDFMPAKNVTRGQFASFINRAINLKDNHDHLPTPVKPKPTPSNDNNKNCKKVPRPKPAPQPDRPLTGNPTFDDPFDDSNVNKYITVCE